MGLDYLLGKYHRITLLKALKKSLLNKWKELRQLTNRLWIPIDNNKHIQPSNGDEKQEIKKYLCHKMHIKENKSR